jgi:hypothetical protein
VTIRSIDMGLIILSVLILIFIIILTIMGDENVEDYLFVTIIVYIVYSKIDPSLHMLNLKYLDLSMYSLIILIIIYKLMNIFSINIPGLTW